MTTRRRPYRSHLYSSWRRNSPHPQSEIARARCRLRTMPRDVEVFDHDHVVLADQAGAGAVQEVGAARCGPCGARGPPSPRPCAGWPTLSGSGPCAAGSGPGSGPCAPGAAGWRSCPRRWWRRSPSRPGRRRRRARCPARGSGAAASTVKVTYQRPSGSRETITIAGSSVVTSTSGQDHTYRSARAHLGQPQLAAAHGERAAGVVRGLPGAAGLEPRVPGTPGEERGERLCAGAAAPAAAAREDTSFRNARSGSFFIAVSARSDSAYDVPLPSQVPAGLAGGQGAVPHDPDAAERARQHLLLRLVGVGPAPVCRPHPYRIARVIEKLREPRRTGGCLFLPRCAGHRIPPRPEDQGILREAW